MGWSTQVVIASQVIIEGTDDGIFVYSGAAGPGTLIGSWVPPGVTQDPYGNVVKPGGITIYSLVSPGQDIFLGLSAATGLSELAFSTGAAMEAAPGGIVSAAIGAGATEVLELELSSPTGSTPGATDRMTLQLFSNNAGGTSVAQALLTYVPAAGPVQNIIAVTNNALVLVDQSPAPGAAAGQAALYGAGGNLAFASGLDGNDYDTARLTVVSPGQTVNTTAPTAVLSAAVNAGTYHFRAWMLIHGGSAAGTGLFAATGPSTSTCQVSWRNAGSGAAVTTNTAYQNALGLAGFGSQTLSISNQQMMEMEALVTFTASGTFAVTVAEGTAGDTVIIGKGSYLEAFPVN